MNGNFKIVYEPQLWRETRQLSVLIFSLYLLMDVCKLLFKDLILLIGKNDKYTIFHENSRFCVILLNIILHYFLHFCFEKFSCPFSLCCSIGLSYYGLVLCVIYNYCNIKTDASLSSFEFPSIEFVLFSLARSKECIIQSDIGLI